MAHHRWLRACAIVFLMAGQIARADDKVAVPDGYKTVRLPSGETILVRDQAPQTSASTDSDKYDPRRYDLNQSSSLANKSFVTGVTPIPQKDISFEQSSSLIKSYALPVESDHAMPNLNTKFPTSASNAFGRNATGLNKSFDQTDSNPMGKQTAVFASSTSSFQGRTALFNEHSQKTFASPLADKSYQEKIPVIPQKNGKINAMDLQQDLKDLPDRPLTIDEVRALINHGVKPDTDAKPEPASKPLNDPDYQPDPAPAPEAPSPSPAPASEDDKNDPVPPPGTMAQPPPENSEPLPQH